MTAMTRLHDLLDRAATRWPGRTAVRDGERALSYRELAAATRRLAGWLTRVGVARGDRVVIALPVDTVVPALLYACSRIGAVFVVLRAELPAPVLTHVLDDCEPALLLTDDANHGELARARQIIHFGLAAARAAAGDGSGRVAGPGPLTVDPCCLIYTSGSTGMPKAVVSPHAQVVFAVQAIQSQLEYRPDDVVFCALPLAFDYGLYQVFLTTLAGAELSLADAARAGQSLLVGLTRARATVLPAVPPLAMGLARLLARPGATPPTLRLLTNTGAAMPALVLRELRSRIPTLRVQLMFGLTECKRTTIMDKDEDLRRPGALGRALPGTEILIVDENGHALPAGDVGELVVRGPHVMAGYWRRPELTAQRFERVDGLFPRLRTGDFAWLDDEGYLYFVGRRDDVYKERGFRVSTIEVETAAQRIGGVQAAAVLAPDRDGQGATLLVVGDLPAQEVLSRLRDHLEDIKVPQHCVVVPALPVTANGKVDRQRLAALAGGSGGRARP